MSINHPSKLTQAFDTIHGEVRRLQCENADLRRQVNQKNAACDILADRNKDLERSVNQLRGHIARKFGPADGVDVTAIVQVVA